MTRGLAFVAMLMAGAAAAAPNPTERAKPGSPEPVMRAEIRDMPQAGIYRVGMTLSEDAPVWIFLRSGLARGSDASWRPEGWTVLTPGVELTRIGHHDALIAKDGGDLPRNIVIQFRPYTGLLEADYQPAMDLGDGSVAIFSDHFTMRPAPSIAAVQQLGQDWTPLPDYEGGHPVVSFRGDGFFDGSDYPGRFSLEEASYVIHGDIVPTVGPYMSTIIDAELPTWLGTQIEAETPQVLDFYAERLGPHESGTPELLISWNGPTPGTSSLGGSVIGDQIVMQIEGDMLVEESRGLGANARQFIAHESAHFWLGNLVDYGRPGDAWSTEGGADLMALRAGEAIDPEVGPRFAAAVKQQAWGSCLQGIEGGPLATAPERGLHSSFYGCGLLFSLVAEKAAQEAGGDFFTFWSDLIEANREGGTVSAEEWIAHYEAIGGSAAAAAFMRTIAFDRGGDFNTLSALLAYAGVSSPAGPRAAPSS
ncbi:hypothetical protein [Sphingomicrobium sediminis]|uniref:Peptidase M1 membrane alanine aminopeptidase domain-containing protein n=1 Tax=Sphingomicrobium sediminis TaxID=2950949 RepID=A0A9X2EGX5_9SPHN|nr:hypothetical protein [Sphingomicrobium sediminis]MCM8557818.1 hypothetical protein [Sphingomicrobium sediminis]